MFICLWVYVHACIQLATVYGVGLDTNDAQHQSSLVISVSPLALLIKNVCLAHACAHAYCFGVMQGIVRSSVNPSHISLRVFTVLVFFFFQAFLTAKNVYWQNGAAYTEPSLHFHLTSSITLWHGAPDNLYTSSAVCWGCWHPSYDQLIERNVIYDKTTAKCLISILWET